MVGRTHGGNPFEYGQAVTPATLVDREDELARLVETVANGGRLFLIGPRRYGKTSLLNLAEVRLEAQGLSCSGWTQRSSRQPSSWPRPSRPRRPRARGARRPGGQDRAELLRRVRPDVTYNLEDHSLSVAFNLRRERAVSGVPLVANVLDGIEALAKARRKRVVVIIDEFQQLVAAGGLQRSVNSAPSCQMHPHVSYVFAGSDTRLLIDMTSNRARPFYRLRLCTGAGSCATRRFPRLPHAGVPPGHWHRDTRRGRAHSGSSRGCAVQRPAASGTLLGLARGPANRASQCRVR